MRLHGSSIPDRERVWAGNVQLRCSLPRRLTLNSTTPHSLHLLIETAEDGLIPAYFNTMPSLNPITLPKIEQTREASLISKLTQSINNFEKSISTQREEVYQIFEKFVSQLNHLRYY